MMCFAEYLPDAIETKCSKCNDKLTKAIQEVLCHVKQNHLAECFDPLVKKYDPEGKRRGELDEFIKC